MVRFRTRGHGSRRTVYPIRRGFGPRYNFPTAGRRSSFTQAHWPRVNKPIPSTPQDAIKWFFSLGQGREQIENEVLSYVSSEFGQELAAVAKPYVKAAVRIRPGVGIKPVVELETKRSELRGTVGLDFPIDLSVLPMGQITTHLAKEPKFYVRVESHVRFTKKRLKVRVIDARVGFSARPIGSDNPKDIHWGKTFRLPPSGG